VTVKVWYTFVTCKSRSNGRSATLHGMLKHLVTSLIILITQTIIYSICTISHKILKSNAK